MGIQQKYHHICRERDVCIVCILYTAYTIYTVYYYTVYTALTYNQSTNQLGLTVNHMQKKQLLLLFFDL